MPIPPSIPYEANFTQNIRLRKTNTKYCRMSEDIAHIYKYNDYTLTVRIENKDFIPHEYLSIDSDIFSESKYSGIYINKNNEIYDMVCVKFCDPEYYEWFTIDEINNDFDKVYTSIK